MEEVQACVSRVKRILYHLHGGNGSPCKQWDFKTEEVYEGKLLLSSNFYRIQQFQEALKHVDGAFIKVQNALASTKMDKAKEASLRWVAEERAARCRQQQADQAAALTQEQEQEAGPPQNRGRREEGDT